MQRMIAGVAVLTLLIGNVCVLHAQEAAAPVVQTPVSAPPTVVPPPRAIDASDLSAYVDGLVDAAMEREGIAGVAVAVVDKQGPLLLRGYGIADQDPRRAVTPDRTLFRIGSVSKTFTYLLGLKLVDAGRLKLDAPVNDYLPPKLKLPDDGYKPVLVRHLFTHTAGFEDSAMGHLFADKASGVPALDDYLVRHRPARVREPGTHAVYSNYSVALLGALIAHVESADPGSESGASFDTLVERTLFAPMGMRLTTFREPLVAGDPRNASAAFKGLWSQGFQRSGGGFKKEAFEHIAQIGPAGGASSNAADMGRYLRMLINGGELDGVRVLSPSEFARLSGEPLFRNAPQGTGFSYGFFNRRYGQVESLEHGGATSWFHSNAVAVPALGVGIFVSTNTDTGRKFAAQLPEKILERYFARARPAALPKPVEKFDATRFVGNYNSERSNYTTVEKLLLATPAVVSAGEGNSLVLTVAGDSSRWLPEGGMRFREAEGQGHITFLADTRGRVTGFAGAGGHNVFARAGVFDTANALSMLLGLAAVTAILVLVGAWLRRDRRVRDHGDARRSAFWLYVTALAWIIFLAAFGVAVFKMSSDEIDTFYHYPGQLLPVAVWLSLPAMLLSLVCAFLLWPAWRAREWNVWRKLRHTLATIVFVVSAYLLWAWNLVGWKL